MYVLVRKDLPSAVQSVQASHSAIESATHSLTKNQEHPHLVLLSVKNEKELLKAIDRIESLGVKFFTFYDSDFNEYTATASELVRGEKRKVFKKYQLLKT